MHFFFAVLWILISAFSYGYHISALNGAQDVITCRSSNHHLSHRIQSHSLSLLAPCIPMSDNLFGLLTSSYTVGGFLGSVYASKLAESRGKRNTLVISALSIAVGSLLMSISNFFSVILIGRTIIGIGCGINTVLVPIYLSHISPIQIRGSVGVMNQLAIVIGIFTAQLISLPLSTPFIWRWIFIISVALSTLQLISAPLVNENYNHRDEHEHLTANSTSGAHLDRHHPTTTTTTTHSPALDSEATDDILDPPQQSITSDSSYHHHLERATLLGHTENDQPHSNQHLPILKDSASSTDSISLAQLFHHWKRDPALASGMKVLLITQVAQQLSGINAVLYYSTSIMKSVLPTQAIYISLFITAINVIMTFPPIFLVDKVGRKSLLLISACSMAITSFILGFSINYEIAHISSLAIILFVASFSVGLGPIPFVILSEVVPSYAVGAAGSLGLALNWASNFLVGLVFLPLRNLMASPDGDGDGNVFFIFTVFGIISSSLINKMYHHQV